MSVTAAPNSPPPRFKIKFWWPDRQPEQVIDPVTALTFTPPTTWEVLTPTDTTWRLPKPGTTWQTLLDYVAEHGLTVGATQILTTRRTRRWEGLYELTLIVE